MSQVTEGDKFRARWVEFMSRSFSIDELLRLLRHYGPRTLERVPAKESLFTPSDFWRLAGEAVLATGEAGRLLKVAASERPRSATECAELRAAILSSCARHAGWGRPKARANPSAKADLPGSHDRLVQVSFPHESGNKMTNKRGQYWTPEQGKEIIDWWNRQSHLPRATWDQEKHVRFLNDANFVDSNDTPQAFIAIEGHGEQPLGTFLFVAEQLREPLPQSRIYKAEHEKDPRWVERMAPALIKQLGLSLSYEVVEASSDGMKIVRSTSEDQTGKPMELGTTVAEQPDGSL